MTENQINVNMISYIEFFCNNISQLKLSNGMEDEGVDLFTRFDDDVKIHLKEQTDKQNFAIGTITTICNVNGDLEIVIALPDNHFVLRFEYHDKTNDDDINGKWTFC